MKTAGGVTHVTRTTNIAGGAIRVTRTITTTPRVAVSSPPPTVRTLLLDLLESLQMVARVIGYGLAFVGGSLFALGVFCLADAGPSPWIEEPFRWSGYWLLPSWLLLRFAAGLFPFGRRLFKWQ